MAILDNYYNRFDTSKKYTKTLFLANRGLQSAELNEVQDYFNHGLKEVGDAIFKSGDVVSGCTCVIDSETGAVTVEAGKIYLDGLIREIHEGNLEIPTNVSVKIGVYYKEQTVTELEDSTLRDPAVGTRNFQEVGALRTQYLMTWAYQVDGVTEEDNSLGEFYTIYNVENGVLVQKALAPQMDSVSTTLARYDDESNGSYIVNGMIVTCLSSSDTEQMFSISEGKAHVNGYEVGLNTSLRSIFNNEIDLQQVESDPYIFEPDALGNMTINLNYAPLGSVDTVDITAEKTTTLIHGSYSGALDPIPSTSVLEIMQIKQGNTTYVKGTDYKLTSGRVDWSLSGAEPAPGSSYEIIYRHRTQVTPTNVTDTSIDISGAVDGSMVLVTYTWKMPRYDLITIDSNGIVRRVKGLAHPWTPAVPKAPSGQFILAVIQQTWETNSMPGITNTAIRATDMSEIATMKQMIEDLYYLMAQERLKTDANFSDPATKKGIFVDPFYDDDMRDQGIEQTAAVVNGRLQLPIDFSVEDFAKDEKVYMLPYTLEAVISQPMLTGYMKVNPYSAFDPIPADLEITLNVDHWVDQETQWTSSVTQNYEQHVSYNTLKSMVGGQNIITGRNGTTVDSVSTSTQVVGTSKQKAQFMRQITQKFFIDGFKSGENIRTVTFAGKTITAQEI